MSPTFLTPPTSKPTVYAQGDVLIVAISSIPDSAAPVPNDGVVTVAYGEATGHRHSIYSDRVKLFREDGSGGGIYLMVSGAEPVGLTHQEHKTINLPPGCYGIRIQRTYHAGIVRNVAD